MVVTAVEDLAVDEAAFVVDCHDVARAWRAVAVAALEYLHEHALGNLQQLLLAVTQCLHEGFVL